MRSIEECYTEPKELANHNRDKLLRLLGYSGIDGNEKADILAQNALEVPKNIARLEGNGSKLNKWNIGESPKKDRWTL